MHVYKKRIIVLAGMCCLGLVLATSDATAQNTESETNVEIGNTCESNIARLDRIHSEAGENGLIIAIARLGNGEQSRQLNERRLQNLRLYLEKVRGRAPRAIITAQAARTRGRGRVEIYLGGKLVDVFGVKRGEDLYAGSCDGTDKLDKYFYARAAAINGEITVQGQFYSQRHRCPKSSYSRPALKTSEMRTVHRPPAFWRPNKCR